MRLLILTLIALTLLLSIGGRDDMEDQTIYIDTMP